MVVISPCGSEFKTARAVKAAFDGASLFVVSESTPRFDLGDFVRKSDLAGVEFVVILFDDDRKFTTVRQSVACGCEWPAGMGGFTCPNCK